MEEHRERTHENNMTLRVRVRIPSSILNQLIPKGGRVSFLLSLLGRDQKTTQEDEIKLLIDCYVGIVLMVRLLVAT